MLTPFSVLAITAGILSFTCSVTTAVSSDINIPADTPISHLLDSAHDHLSRGETNKALSYYDAALSRDPSDPLTFFKRATTYLSLGKTSSATDDFNKVLELQPGFEGAHVQLAKLKSKTADWEGAREHYAKARRLAESPELIELAEAEGGARLATVAEQSKKWDECISHAGVAITVASRATSLRELRARCRFERGDLEEGLQDLRHLLLIRPADPTPLIRMSVLRSYSLGDIPKALEDARKCLQSDQDSKLCRKILKRLKTTEKALDKIEKSIEGTRPATGVRGLVGSDTEPGLITEIKQDMEEFVKDGVLPSAAPRRLYSKVVELTCRCYYEMESSRKKAQPYCDETLELNPKALYGLLWRAKTQFDDEKFEAAIKSLNDAGEAHPSQQNLITPLKEKARIALKRSQTKDYYKTLGVAQDADERQIKSAYRQLSKQYHPDKAAALGLSQEDAQKRMASINEAYEVLSNPELRARFDQGVDPNAPGGREQSSHPFSGFHPFMQQQGPGGGGSYQNFKFTYGF